jgi:molecular chaperone GrpE
MAEANEESKKTDGEEAVKQEAKQPEPTPPPREPIPVTISDIELEQLKREASDFKMKYQRALADAENSRKRLQKENQELVQYAMQNVFVDFLGPIDHMENALGFTEQASTEVQHWAYGFKMILNQFKDVLSNNGVTAFKSIGERFDPHRHEAVETVETTDYPPGTVVSESICGYKSGDRIVRPARVKVAKAPAAAAPQNEEQEEIQKEDK